MGQAGRERRYRRRMILVWAAVLVAALAMAWLTGTLVAILLG